MFQNKIQSDRLSEISKSVKQQDLFSFFALATICDEDIKRDCLRLKYWNTDLPLNKTSRIRSSKTEIRS